MMSVLLGSELDTLVQPFGDVGRGTDPCGTDNINSTSAFMAPSSSGQGHGPLKAGTAIRIR